MISTWEAASHHLETFLKTYFLGGSVVKNPPANTGAAGDGFSLSVRMSPWRWNWQPTSVFLPGESHGQRSLASYSPWGHNKLNMTEWLEHAHRDIFDCHPGCVFLAWNNGGCHQTACCAQKQLLAAQNCPAQNVNSAKDEKPSSCRKEGVILSGQAIWYNYWWD